MISENEPGVGSGRRRAKRFLSPSQKYEIWLQLVRQEVTIAEAATKEAVDRTTIMRIRTVADHRGPGLAEVAHRGRLGRGDPHHSGRRRLH